MQEQGRNDENKVVDFKQTLGEFVKEDMPEISQEDAIRQYKEVKGKEIIKPKKKHSEDEENEDDEHLKRVKKELLESLKRVEELSKQIFNEKDRDNIKNIKVNKKSSGGGKKQEQVLEQMRQVQDDMERSRE